MNQVKSRLQALGLLDRSIAAASDDDVDAVVASLGDDHRDALEQLVDGDVGAESIRAAVATGRLDGTMESVALVLTDAALADCIEQLGDHADHPTSDQLREVLPGLVERHGVAIVRVMLASTVAGEAPASAVIRDLLKHDDRVKLPPAEPKPLSPIIERDDDPDERAAIKAKRKEQKARKQEEARARREQAARAKGRA